MRFMGKLFTGLICLFVVGFFIDWFDVTKKDGVVSFHVNSAHIGKDLRATGQSARSFVEYLGNP